MEREILYIKIARTIEEQIVNETLRIGDKLPSLRSLQQMYKVSLNTIKHAFYELESKSLIESRPRAGYFVSMASKRKVSLTEISEPLMNEKSNRVEELTRKIFEISLDRSIRQFSLGIPDDSLLPIAKLNKSMIKAMNSLVGSGTAYEPAQGNINLRRNVAKWSLVLEGKLGENDLVTTLGTMNALFYCLNAVTKRGDTIATESPVYFGILRLAHSMGLHVIELPTHPITGLELDALQSVIHKVKAVCLTANFSNPLGSLMPDENKRKLVDMLTYYNVPLIEDDLFGNLYFGGTRPKPCKFFDEAGIVMWCGGVSKTLAPGYRVGWVAPGKFKDNIIWQKLTQTISLPSLQQEAIADFLEYGRYDHHLRSFRNNLHSNCLKFQRAIEAYFPDNTKVSQPQGGYFLWMELDQQIDTAALLNLAIKQKISFVPGRMFTQHNQFNNCLRLNFALKWDAGVEHDLKRLGTFVKHVTR